MNLDTVNFTNLHRNKNQYREFNESSSKYNRKKINQTYCFFELISFKSRKSI